MKEDEIIEMARQAGCETAFGLTHPPILQAVAFKKSQLEAFVRLAAAKEREACAELAQKTVCDTHIPTGVKIYGTAAAKAIRARGEA